MTEDKTAVTTADVALCDLGVDDLRCGFRQNSFTPVDVLASVHRRSRDCEATINALWYPDFDAAHVLAEQSAQRWATGKPLGPLDGVPVTVKENIARQGVPKPSGHAASRLDPATCNAPITERLHEAGALVFASTVMPDWGMLSSGVSSRHGITRSPLNPELTTGGSSAGAGAAAAAGYGPIHIGTDIGGSIRLPGTWLGLAAHKPSYGRVPLAAPYIGRCAGPLARRVTDVRHAMDAIAQPDQRDYAQLPPRHGNFSDSLNPSQLRIGVHVDAGCGEATDPQISAIVRHCADLFADAGAAVSCIEPFMDDQLLSDVDRFLRVRSWLDYATLSIADQRKILPHVAAWCSTGADISGAEVLRCYNAIQDMRRRAVEAGTPYDFVLSPVAPMAAFPADWPMPFKDPQLPMQHIGFTVPYNMSEQPAISVHAGMTDDSRTVGVQIAGPRFDDSGVLAAAEWLERTLALPLPTRVVGRDTAAA